MQIAELGLYFAGPEPHSDGAGHRISVMAKKQKEPQPDLLQGWQQIAHFLAQPVAVVQNWARSGMPVRKTGRYMTASRTELNRWLAGESGGQPVQITSPGADLGAELRRGLRYVRSHRKHAA